MEDVETIECALELNVNGLWCLTCLVALTLVVCTWSLCLRSGIIMDVYDRDALIRAVSLKEAPSDGTFPSTMRIFVHSEDAGKLSVIVSDSTNVQRGCSGLLRNVRPAVEADDRAPVSDTTPQSNATPVR